MMKKDSTARIGPDPWFDQEAHDELAIEGNDTITVFSERVSWADGEVEGQVKVHFWFGPISGDILLGSNDAIQLGEMLRKHGERAKGFEAEEAPAFDDEP